MCFGTRQLRALFEVGAGVHVALRAERVAGVDDGSGIGGRSVGHPSELLDSGDELVEYLGVGGGCIDRAQCGDGVDRVSEQRHDVAVGGRVHMRAFLGVVDWIEASWWRHRTRERTDRRSPCVEIFQTRQRRVRVDERRRLGDGRTHGSIMTRGCHRVGWPTVDFGGTRRVVRDANSGPVRCAPVGGERLGSVHGFGFPIRLWIPVGHLIGPEIIVAPPPRKGKENLPSSTDRLANGEQRVRARC